MKLLLALTASLLIAGLGHVFSKSTSSELIDTANRVSKRYEVPRRDYVVLIDYSKPIFVDRLHVVDMMSQTVVLSARVSHAYNSGLVYANDFSNVAGSKKSSLGAYVTGGTKHGRFGYSMYVRGLESQNSNAYSRSIIFHSTEKMDFIWSAGCFATSGEINERLINLVKGGSLVYVFK